MHVLNPTTSHPRKSAPAARRAQSCLNSVRLHRFPVKQTASWASFSWGHFQTH
jgi:hypothetical protein